jgi:single-strand DNA-binding protein
MSNGYNRVTLLGNLGADPEYKVLVSGTRVLKLRLATSETYKDKEGVKQETTQWHALTIWDGRAEALSKILKKGDRILAEGSIRYSALGEGSEKKYFTDIHVSDIVLCGGGKQIQEAPQTRQARKPVSDEIPF